MFDLNALEQLESGLERIAAPDERNQTLKELQLQSAKLVWISKAIKQNSAEAIERAREFSFPVDREALS